MAGKPVTIIGSNDNAVTPTGNLFEGLKFFVLQRVPLRKELVQKILSNGGAVVKHEDAADYRIADHARKDAPPGSISWTFIDASFRDKTLANPENHLAGPKEGAARIVGSVITPGKSMRTPFTAQDDRILWEWVERARLNGALIRGNEIYKDLEKCNPRHTYQSWRDRYVKKLSSNPPDGVNVVTAADGPPTPPEATDHDDIAEPVAQHQRRDETRAIRGPEAIPNHQRVSTISEKGSTRDSNVQGTDDALNRTANHRKLVRQPSPENEAKITTTDRSTQKRRRESENVGSLPPVTARKSGEPISDGYPSLIGRTRPTAKRSRVQDGDGIRRILTAQDVRPASPKLSNDRLLAELERATTPRKIGNTAHDVPSQSKAKTSPHGVDESNGGAHPAGNSSKLALTKANLASQQAQEKGQVIRGVDLPEDDEAKDQTPWAEYLTDLVRQGTKSRVPSVIRSPEDVATAGEPKTLRNTLLAERDSMPRPQVTSDSIRRTGSKTNESREKSGSPRPQTQTKPQEITPPGGGVVYKRVVPTQVETHDEVDVSIPSPGGNWDALLPPNVSTTNFPHSRVERKRFRASADSTPRKDHKSVAPVATVTEISSPTTSATSSVAAANSIEEDELRQQQGERYGALNTQDIVSAETQFPDLELPLPPDSDDESDPLFVHSTEPYSRASPQEQGGEAELEPEEAVPEDLSAWARTMMQRGYTVPNIMRALEACSARTELAALVLFEEKCGRGFPSEVPGIWSEEEDTVLESGDARGLKRLEEKHSWDECDARMKHLADRRELEDE